MGQTLDIVNKFMQEQDTSVVADDFKFIGPVDQKNGKEEYLQLAAEFSPLVAGMRMLHQFESDNNVCSIYEMDVNLPNGVSTTMKIADWVIVKDGQIVEEHLMYDAREYAASKEQ